MQLPSFHKTVITIVTIGLLTFVGAAAFYSPPVVSPPIQEKAIVLDHAWNPSLKEMTPTIFQVFIEIHIAGLLAFEEPELMRFFENDLQQTCPFYIPSGVAYRACVEDLIAKEKIRLAGLPEFIENVITYCDEGTKKTAPEGTIGNIGIRNACILYKLQWVPSRTDAIQKKPAKFQITQNPKNGRYVLTGAEGMNCVWTYDGDHGWGYGETRRTMGRSHVLIPGSDWPTWLWVQANCIDSMGKTMTAEYNHP